MLKKITITIFCLILLSGCNNKVETEKNTYLDVKKELEKTSNFTAGENLPCDIEIHLERKDPEEINYVLTLSNPKENMNTLKILLIHNQYTEDIVPNYGLLNDKAPSLTTNSEDKITIKNSISSTNDIKSLNIEFRLLLEYTTDTDQTKTYYYKTTI